MNKLDRVGHYNWLMKLMVSFFISLTNSFKMNSSVAKKNINEWFPSLNKIQERFSSLFRQTISNLFNSGIEKVLATTIDCLLKFSHSSNWPFDELNLLKTHFSLDESDRTFLSTPNRPIDFISYTLKCFLIWATGSLTLIEGSIK